MWTEWTKNAVEFGIEYADAYGAGRAPDATSEELATWLNANPTGSFEDWRKEKYDEY